MNLNNEPIEYVRGFTEFLGCKIDLSKKPLIPRVETEFWVGKVIEKLKIENSLKIANCKLKILDLFAGSGCIGIAILTHIKNSHVVFADSEQNCISQIRINLKLNNLAGKVIKSDVLFSPSLRGFRKSQSNLTDSRLPRRPSTSLRAPCNDNLVFDFIFANPPYIPVKNKNKVQKSVLDFEPHKALFGGEDGLFYIRRFLKDAKNYLNPGGKIFMEFDGSAGSPQVSPQKKEIEKLARKLGYKTREFHKDQFGKCRAIMLK